MVSSNITVNGADLHILRSGPGRSARTILMLHGLGDCCRAFTEVFKEPGFGTIDIVVPDLPGYGYSAFPPNELCGLQSRVNRISQLVDALSLSKFCVVGHSMGADLATLMARSDNGDRIIGIVNIEGDMTPADRFITSRVVKAVESGRFSEWFRDDFMTEQVLRKLASQGPSGRRYLESLLLCQPEAFRADAEDLHRWNESIENHEECELARLFSTLSIPKVFCWGSHSLSKGTLAFLQKEPFRHERFDGAGHWVMIDRSDRFYPFLLGFLDGLSW